MSPMAFREREFDVIGFKNSIVHRIGAIYWILCGMTTLDWVESSEFR